METDLKIFYLFLNPTVQLLFFCLYMPSLSIKYALATNIIIIGGGGGSHFDCVPDEGYSKTL
jgi:hypothetical protein